MHSLELELTLWLTVFLHVVKKLISLVFLPEIVYNYLRYPLEMRYQWPDHDHVVIEVEFEDKH